MGTKYYDWAGAEVITAARLNSAFDASGNLDLDAATSLKTIGTGVAGGEIKAIYLDNTATDGGAIYFDAGSTEYIKSNAAGTTLTIAGFTTVATACAIDFDGGSFTFNNAAADKDFLCKGDTDTQLFKCDAGGDVVLIGANALEADFTGAKIIVSAGDTGLSSGAVIGLVSEARAAGTTYGSYSIGYSTGAGVHGYGVYGMGVANTDTSDAYGGYFTTTYGVGRKDMYGVYAATQTSGVGNTYGLYSNPGTGVKRYGLYIAAGEVLVALAGVQAAANNAAAAALGIAVGGFYRTNADPSVLCIRSA